jgi:hypothetical protein
VVRDRAVLERYLASGKWTGGDPFKARPWTDD